jgi:hypothetical protein
MYSTCPTCVYPWYSLSQYSDVSKAGTCILPVYIPGTPGVNILLYPGQGHQNHQAQQPVQGTREQVQEDVAHAKIST